MTVHDLAQARLAVAAAHALPVRLILLSAPAAAGFLGPGWWLALIRALRLHGAALDVGDRLDCGTAAGRAMEALRLGQRGLILSPDCPQFEAVSARASALGARLDGSRPPTLDLAASGAARRLRHWLETGPPGSPRP